jgi:hypothetical protein
MCLSLSQLPASLSLRSSVSWSLPLATVFVFSSSSPVVLTDKARQAEIKRQDRTRPTQTRPHKASPDKSQPAVSSRLSASRFACPTRYDDLASSSDEDEPSSPVCPQFFMPADPFSALRVPPPTVSAFRVSYDLDGLPVTVPLPFVSPQPYPPIPTTTSPPSLLGAVSALLPSSPLIVDSGWTGLLIQLSNFSALAPFFSCKPLPSVPFTLPDGSSLQVGGPSHLTGFLTFPHKQSPVACYFLPASDLSHSLFGVSPLIPHGHAVFTNLSCSFFDSSTSSVPFLSGLKAVEADLWHLSVPLVPVAPSLAVAAPLPCSSALFSLQSLPAARFVAYWHRAFGSPPLSTFIKALTKGYVHGIPLPTAKLVSKYPPLSLSISFGHLDTLQGDCLDPQDRLSLLSWPCRSPVCAPSHQPSSCRPPVFLSLLFLLRLHHSSQ